VLCARTRERRRQERRGDAEGRLAGTAISSLIFLIKIGLPSRANSRSSCLLDTCRIATASRSLCFFRVDSAASADQISVQCSNLNTLRVPTCEFHQWLLEARGCPLSSRYDIVTPSAIQMGKDNSVNTVRIGQYCPNMNRSTKLTDFMFIHDDGIPGIRRRDTFSRVSVILRFQQPFRATTNAADGIFVDASTRIPPGTKFPSEETSRYLVFEMH